MKDIHVARGVSSFTSSDCTAPHDWNLVAGSGLTLDCQTCGLHVEARANHVELPAELLNGALVILPLTHCPDCGTILTTLEGTFDRAVYCEECDREIPNA